MHIAGLVMYLFSASVMPSNAPQAALHAQTAVISQDQVAQPDIAPRADAPPVVSPDPAPPHPLKPRVPLPGPLTGLARVAEALAKGVLRDHGR
jgi:hypothetical protein